MYTVSILKALICFNVPLIVVAIDDRSRRTYHSCIQRELEISFFNREVHGIFVLSIFGGRTSLPVYCGVHRVFLYPLDKFTNSFDKFIRQLITFTDILIILWTF
jgi:hypothetical protein